jgi:hypothetical protein
MNFKFNHLNIFYLAIFILLCLNSWLIRSDYLGQIPVFDSDVETSITLMWVNLWLSDINLAITLSKPFYPMDGSLQDYYHLYQSWPPIGTVPVYLASLFLGEANIYTINVINTLIHFLIAFFSGMFILEFGRKNGISNFYLTIFASLISFFIIYSISN